MSKTTVVATCVLFLVATGAEAAEPVVRGFYLGGMAGATELEYDDDFGYGFTESDTGYAIFGGYKILKHLAVEARVSNLGKYGDDLANAELTAASAHVVGIIPFGVSGWELYGQLGVGTVNVDTNCCGDSDDTVGSAGLGVRFHPTPHLAIGVQMDGYAYDGYEEDVTVVTTQIGIKYIF